MSNDFEPLRADEVVSVKNALKLLVGHPTFKVRELKQVLRQILQDYDSAVFIENRDNEKTECFFTKGINADVLKYGAKGWQQGKVRLKFTLEFCPDEPELTETRLPNQSEISEPESPLDEIRRMQG